MTTTAMLDKTLWAVSIHGPDDLIPVADYLTALRFANRFNEWWQQQKTAKPLHPYDPRMWAVPVEWAGDADRHAEWVKTPSPDYAPFLSAPLSHAAGDVVGVLERAEWYAKFESQEARLITELAATLLALSARAEAAEAREAKGAVADIAAERRRQMEAEGWSPEHDDKHDKGELAGAAACYAMNDLNIHNIALGHRIVMIVRDLWPWALSWWKPTDHRRNLVKAGALIVAEIERRDRLAARSLSPIKEAGNV